MSMMPCNAEQMMSLGVMLRAPVYDVRGHALRQRVSDEVFNAVVWEVKESLTSGRKLHMERKICKWNLDVHKV